MRVVGSAALITIAIVWTMWAVLFAAIVSYTLDDGWSLGWAGWLIVLATYVIVPVGWLFGLYQLLRRD